MLIFYLFTSLPFTFKIPFSPSPLLTPSPSHLLTFSPLINESVSLNKNGGLFFSPPFCAIQCFQYFCTHINTDGRKITTDIRHNTPHADIHPPDTSVARRCPVSPYS